MESYVRHRALTSPENHHQMREESTRKGFLGREKVAKKIIHPLPVSAVGGQRLDGVAIEKIVSNFELSASHDVYVVT